MENPGLVLAFGAGVLSFLSPCCLPIYPSYLSYLTGLSVGELQENSPEVRSRVLRHAIVFVLGFSVIWVALGLSASVLGQFFYGYRDLLTKVGGILVTVMGLSLLGVIRIPFLMREARVQLAQKPQGYVGTFVVGLAFAAGWTPCIGPILTAVLAVAMQSPGQGAPLLLAFSLGFAVPFLALAYALGSARWLARYSLVLERVGGALMVAMGLLLVTGRLSRLTAWLIDLTGFSGF